MFVEIGELHAISGHVLQAAQETDSPLMHQNMEKPKRAYPERFFNEYVMMMINISTLACYEENFFLNCEYKCFLSF